jgi:hypothetical protein
MPPATTTSGLAGAEIWRSRRRLAAEVRGRGTGRLPVRGELAERLGGSAGGPGRGVIGW